MMDLTPDPAQKRLWFIQLVLVTSTILLLFLVPLTAAQSVQTGPVFAYFAAVWLLIGGAVATWIPLYFKSLRYEVGGEELYLTRGVLWKQRVAIPYENINRIELSRGPMERLFGIGRVTVRASVDSGHRMRRPDQALIGLKNPDGIRVEIEAKVRQQKNATTAAGGESGHGSESDQLRAIQDELKDIRALLEEVLAKER